MAPLTQRLLHNLQLLPRSSNTAISEDASQWKNPGDILSLLLIVGGDAVQRAIAQLAGDSKMPTPVVFSFGWVAYAFMALLSTVGDGRLMPAVPDQQTMVIEAKSGYGRTNQSWILGRVLRDFEHHWMPAQVKSALGIMLGEAKSPKAGLCVSVFEADPDKTAGRAQRDWLWYLGYLVALVQLVLAAIPWIVWGQWDIFVVTAAGTVLAFVGASLPQWRLERWACRRESSKTVCLTQGNGAQHVLVIIGKGRGLNLEDLASSVSGGELPTTTRPLLIGLTILWVALLVTVSGIQQHTWFLLAIGGLGMAYTILVAGAPRRPEAFGIPLRYVNVFARSRVMETLKAVDEEYPGVGQAMITTFFPGDIREEEIQWWMRKKQQGKIKSPSREKTANEAHQTASQPKLPA